MAKITYKRVDGSEDVLDVAPGTTLMQAAVANGIEGIVGECGGSAMCATCHVYVDADPAQGLPPINAVEDEMLESTASERRDNSRLSCQLRVTPEFDGLVLHLPPTQL
jgi:2Fe-2S ferredoxin